MVIDHNQDMQEAQKMMIDYSQDMQEVQSMVIEHIQDMKSVACQPLFGLGILWTRNLKGGLTF